MVAALGRADRADLPARLPDELLLLPQGVLPGLLDEPAGLRGRGAARVVLGRDPAAPDPQQPPSLLLVRRRPGLVDPDLRHRPHLPRRARPLVPHGPGLPGLPGQHRADLALHAVVPLVPARG